MKRLMTLLLAVTLFSLTSAYAQYEVKGIVVDEHNWSVIGATVLQQGTTNGTTTNLDGEFTLRVPPRKRYWKFRIWGIKPWLLQHGMQPV